MNTADKTVTHYRKHILCAVGILVFVLGTHVASAETILRLEAPEIGAQLTEEAKKRQAQEAPSSPETDTPLPTSSTPDATTGAPEISPAPETPPADPFPQPAGEEPLVEAVGPIVDSAVAPNPTAPMVFEELSEEELDELYAEVEAQAAVNVWDPFESFNRDMYAFNDTLNSWVLTPVSKAWAYVIPDEIRMVTHNFFYNIAAPRRIINCLLQGNFKGAGVELGRFAVNTIMGLGGFGDVASAIEPLKQTYDADTDQTLGRYDVPEGPYLVLPVLNFFTIRSLAGWGGDIAMHPFTYVPDASYVLTATSAVRIVNDMSFRLGTYETLRDASIDPYATFRDAYVQYRRKKAQEAKVRQTASEVKVPAEEALVFP